MNKYVVTIKENGIRVDKALALMIPDKSRSYISSIIDEGKVTINDKVAIASTKVKINDVICLEIPEITTSKLEGEDIPLDVIFEDKDIIVINKPQGMVVHPANGHSSGTLVNALLNHAENLSTINGVVRPGIVHRIDKDTSGLICIAKNDIAHQALSKQLKTHTMYREYYALVYGVIKENNGTIDMPISRFKGNRLKMCVDKDGKSATTHFEVVERFKNNTLVKCRLVTGRTHQIRVHMAKIGHPVEGDPLYFGKFYDHLYKKGQLLVAYKLNFIHPTTNKEVSFEIKLPDYFNSVIEKIRSAN